MSNIQDSDFAGYSPRLGSITPTIATSALSQSEILARMDNNNIREGLGSLNRWSQSTVSSSSSPENHHHFAGSMSRSHSPSANYSAPNNKNIDNPPESYVTRETGSHYYCQATKMSNNSDQSPPSLSLATSSHEDNSAPDLSDLSGVLSTFSVGILTATPVQPGAASPDSTKMSPSLFQNPWMKGRISGSSLELQTGALPACSGLETHSPRAQKSEAANEESPILVSGKGRGQERRRGQSQKVMLSKALQKANTAVLLDNAANFEGAMEAYNDACQLLQLVMLRSDGGEDEKLKLQEIRDTYMVRVNELQRMDFSFHDLDSKALPERPLSQESYGESYHPIYDGENETSSADEFACFKRKSGARPIDQPQRQSLLPSLLGDYRQDAADLSEFNIHSRSQSVSRDGCMGTPVGPELRALEGDPSYDAGGHCDLCLSSNHARDANESTSWLDTIDESGASSSASTYSETLSIHLRHGKSRRPTVGTEAEFDAALDAAVEAAYDEGLEPAIDSDNNHDSNDVIANARRNVEMAKQKVREAEREAELALARGREIRHLQDQTLLDSASGLDSDYLDEEAEEEERLLEEMTKGYIMDDFEFGIQSKSALPRQSSLNSFSGRMWESPSASNAMKASANLSTLAEDGIISLADERVIDYGISQSQKRDTSPPPMKSTHDPVSVSGVRARRMSAQHTELKIETNTHVNSHINTPMHGDPLSLQPPPVPKDDLAPSSSTTHLSRSLGPPSALRSIIHTRKQNASIGSFTEDTLTNFNLEKVLLQNDSGEGLPKDSSPTRHIGKVPSAPDNLGKLNAGPVPSWMRNVPVSGPELASESPNTPSGNTFPPGLDTHKGPITASVPILPTPTGNSISANGLPSGGLKLFDSHIHSPTRPGSPNLMAADPPVPLEPCPESFLLRPFWLMRCIRQTITHPRGGYLSTKLFIPREVWRVKNVKIKAVEEKVSNCDLLTAALLKLAKVDAYDADAILEEMQSLESVLDQVQMSLSKKIGSEVGVQGAVPLFKSTQASDDAAAMDILPSKSSNGPSKSYLTSWRKLRSKNSGLGAATSLPMSKEPSKDNLTINTIPMTSLPISHPVRHSSLPLQYNSPNNYMGALARLCDAAQVLDQIAQQVEDPGLKHSSPTLVGLELSTRHAAEFFGFYVCRFALNDIGMMLDKFIKRGSEWVLV
ncbi:hypothetical protein BO70DRAFT_300779 [Aspergillus heteromorphus CBS 117.55]|uniref:MIT domain-containing protein n=1 Tax=Aspergillus heteromorphus CBS 117.55 TaxID=1448321 RepID=A0A317V3Z3_9EURO|nr:uncharacterized protein BO70DRAFT_300779 [Aspergillus heteromorphus CBS 117.55]PWY68061.1 hypothetical protein BO70DRAFT_300779 [Aspergillus heteromorphus CBS 117.55]